MTKQLLLTCCFSAFILISKAQERIETDRPDQTETPYLVPKHYFQGEFGFNKEVSRTGEYILVHPTALLKYGQSKWLEWRLETNLISHHHKENTSNKRIKSFFEPVEIGAKFFLWEANNWIPKASVITQFGLPFLANKEERTKHIAPTLRLLFQNSFSDRVSLGYNVGAQWDGEDTSPYWFYTFAPGFSIGERWYAFVEAYGYIHKNQMPDHNIDGGIAYFISNDVKVDVSGSLGLSPNSLKNYVAVGFSFRNPLKKGSRIKSN